MKIELNLKAGTCLVIKEVGDPYFSGVCNAAGESRLLYHIKKHLNAQGYDFIKKRMAKDGHLVDDIQQYLRSRKININTIGIVNPRWQIEGADKALNRDGRVSFTVHKLGIE